MSYSTLINLQQLIILYKQQLKDNPDCIASKALLARSRAKLKQLKGKQ